MTKIATKHIHVEGVTGDYVSLIPGDRIPAELEDRVTNPKAFTEHEDGADIPAIVSPEDDDHRVVDGAASVEDLVAREPAGTDQSEQTPPPYDPTTEAEADKPYAERAFKHLQEAAKARGLSGAGNADTLVARLEADDRDRAAGTTE